MILNENFLQDLVEYIQQTDVRIFDGSKTSKEDLLKKRNQFLENMWVVYQKDVDEYGCDSDFSYADALKEVLGIDLEAKKQQLNFSQKDSIRCDELNKATYEACCAFAKVKPQWDMSYIEQVNEYVEYALSVYGYPVKHSGVKTHEKRQTLLYAKAEFARLYTPENRKKYEPYLNRVRKLCKVFSERNNNFSLVMLTAIARRVDEALRRNGIETEINGIWQVIHGDYVATPIKNAFNNKTAYWLSKRGVAKACYMFTVENCFSPEDIEERLTEQGFKAYEWFFADSNEPKYGCEETVHRRKNKEDKMNKETEMQDVLKDMLLQLKSEGLRVFQADPQQTKSAYELLNIILLLILRAIIKNYKGEQ